MAQTDIAPTAPKHRSRATRRKRPGRSFVEWVVIVVVAFVAAVLIKTFLIQAFVIPTGSMEPAIDIGNRVLVDKIAYDLHSVHRGDIVVFSRPPADTDTEGGDIKDLIKRVIGLPDETLRSGPHGEIYVDGKLINQPWLTAGAKQNPGPNICGGQSRVDCVGDVLHLHNDQYYMMGDNRGSSDDSRYWGPITKQMMVGHAFVRIWPLSRLHWFSY